MTFSEIKEKMGGYNKMTLEKVVEKMKDIPNYNPCYTGHNITAGKCFKRAKILSSETSHSGLICNNQDTAKVVFLCKQLSDLKKYIEKGAEFQKELIKKINNLESENKELIEIFKHNYKVIKSNDLIKKLESNL